MANDLPNDFLLQADFMDEDEEHRLIEFIQSIPFGSVRMHGVTAKRRVAQFGWRYSFETFHLTPAAELPTALEDLRSRAARVAGLAEEEFSETLITEYPPGAGIGWHRDAPHFGVVAGISLGGECRMRFQRGKGTDRVTAAAILPPRSLYLLRGEARNLWQHTIPPVPARRWSITFRTVRRTSQISS
jgi:alkylated DNA repair protein (DNA oxidative demethylase)